MAVCPYRPRRLDLTITAGTDRAIVDTGIGTVSVMDINASDLTEADFIFV